MRVALTRNRLAILTVVLVGLGTLIVWKLPDWRLQRTLNLASHELKNRDAAAALRHLDVARKLAPQNGEEALLRSRAYRRQGRFDDVRASLIEAQGRGISRARIQREELLALAQSGQMLEAAPRLSELLVNPGDDGADICEAYANGFFLAFRFAEAFELLAAWESDFPNDPQPHMFRGLYFVSNSAWSDARTSYQKAYAIAPHRADIRLKLAETLLGARQSDEALGHLRELMKQHPDDPAIQLGFAKAQVEVGETESARKQLEKLVQSQPNNLDVLVALAQLELTINQPTNALPLLEKVVKERHFDLEAHMALASALQRLGRADEAKTHFEFVNQAQDATVQMQQLRDRIKEKTSDLSLRYQMADAVVNFAPEVDRLMWLQSIVEIDPKQRRAHELLAEYHQSHGNLNSAAKHRSIAESLPSETLSESTSNR